MGSRPPRRRDVQLVPHRGPVGLATRPCAGIRGAGIDPDVILCLRHRHVLLRHDGLVILVDEQRIWFPTDTQRAAQGPVVVELEAPRTARLSLRPTATVLAR